MIWLPTLKESAHFDRPRGIRIGAYPAEGASILIRARGTTRGATTAVTWVASAFDLAFPTSSALEIHQHPRLEVITGNTHCDWYTPSRMGGRSGLCNWLLYQRASAMSGRIFGSNILVLWLKIAISVRSWTLVVS
jgi:hypothetical protein